MQIRFILFSLLIGLGCWTMPGTASADRSVCGVSVKSSRCYRELRRLRKACQQTPVVCGRRYVAGEKPLFRAAYRRCVRMRRRNRRRWVRGLCGVRLFSKPKTYCGKQGVRVATACVAASLPKAPAAPPSVGQVAPRREPVVPPTHNQTPIPRSAPTDPPKPRAALGRVATKPSPRLTTPAPSGTSNWLIFLQVITALLVLYLLFRRQTPRHGGKEWQGSPTWDAPLERWEEQGKQPNQEHLARSIERLEEQFRHWKEEQGEQVAKLNSPQYEMQVRADSLFAYYMKLAQNITQEMALEDGGGAGVRKRLMEAKEELQWLFNAHRELPGQDSLIEEIKASSWHHVQSLLETLGHVSLDAKVAEHMANGQFSGQEFLERKSQDQAYRFVASEDIQSFAQLRDEFLERLEHLYRSNLQSLEEVLPGKGEGLSPEEESELFLRDYVLGYLLEELPLLLQELTRRSSPVNCGALVDQFMRFIEKEIKASGVELFPQLDASMTDTINARLIYLLHAGVRLRGTEMVLRAPDSSVMAVESETPELTHQSAGDSFEETTVASEAASLDSFEDAEELSFEVELPEGARASWFDAPSEEGFFDARLLAEDGDREAQPPIAHPDSDPPEHTAEMTGAVSIGKGATAESLPTGPLPHLENVTQGFEAVPESELPRKVTREYGPTGENK